MTPNYSRSLPVETVFYFTCSAVFGTTLIGIPWLASLAAAFLITIALLELPIPRFFPKRLTPLRAVAIGFPCGVVAGFVTSAHLPIIGTLTLAAAFVFVGCVFAAERPQSPISNEGWSAWAE